MTKPASKHIRGHAMRQALIDYLIAHPGATTAELCAGLGWDQASSAGTRLRRMTSVGELRREAYTHHGIDENGRPYAQRSYRYWALVKKTRTLDEVFGALRNNLLSEDQRTPARRTPSGKWGIRADGRMGLSNDDPHRPCIRNPDGQGVTSPRMICSILGE